MTRITIEQRTTEPLFSSERPHEDFILGYCTVRRIGGQWHMWYEAYDHNYTYDADGFLCYAHSTDGIRWERPNLGLVEYDGNWENNILLSGTAIGGVHGHTVFLDEEAPDEERFKIVFIKPVGAEWWVHGGTSGDGIHWHLIEEPLLKKNSDTKIVCFRDGQLYRLYVRMWTGDLGQGDLYQGKRVVGYTQSPTFGAFPDPQVILQPDEHDPPRMDFYDSAATKLREDLYIIFPTAFYQDENVTRPHAAVSNDGINFSRIGSEPMLELGKGFDSKGIYVAPGPIPGEEPGTYWFYYLGTHIGHDQNLPGKVHAAGGYGRFLVRISE